MDKKKLAIVSTSFPESTLGLVMAMAKRGYAVGYYILSMSHKSSLVMPALEIIDSSKWRIGEMVEVSKQNKGLHGLQTYPDTHVYVYRSIPMRRKGLSIVGRLQNAIAKWLIARMCYFMNSQKYELVDIVIQRDDISSLFAKHLSQSHLVFSFHEIWHDHQTRQRLLPQVERAITNGHKIRLFSDTALRDLRQHASLGEKQAASIPFGLFSSYNDFGTDRFRGLTDWGNYILYFGSIHPYKGLSILTEAVRRLAQRETEVKVVIAGSGYDQCLNTIATDEHFLLINRFITNDELISLIRRCRFVVCPYLSASQSGIPSTVYLFGKPIVATRVGAFPQMVIEGETGLLVTPDSVEELEEAMGRMMADEVLYNRCVAGVAEFEKYFPERSWTCIAKTYEQHFINS